MAFSDPQKNVHQCNLREGMHVADFGSGSGHYTLAASRVVGHSGRVYAVDIQKKLLKRVKNLSSSEHAENIDVIWGDIEEQGGVKLSENSLDGVIIANVLFQLERRREAIAEAYRVLKPGGHAYLIDWSESFGNLGPRPDDVVSLETARALFEIVGFSEERLISDVGDHHYGIVFKKPVS